jgi:hypothetical protein
MKAMSASVACRMTTFFPVMEEIPVSFGDDFFAMVTSSWSDEKQR